MPIIIRGVNKRKLRKYTTRVILGLKESTFTTITIKYGKSVWMSSDSKPDQLLKFVTLILNSIDNHGNCPGTVTLIISLTFIQYSCFARSKTPTYRDARIPPKLRLI